MSSARTLVILPILNDSYTNKFFLNNYKKFCDSYYDIDIILIMKHVTYNTVSTTRDIFKISTGDLKKIRKDLGWCDNIGVISDNNNQVKMSDLINKVCVQYCWDYDQFLILDPYTVLLPEMWSVFEKATLRGGWASISFFAAPISSDIIKKLDMDDANLRLRIKSMDLGKDPDDIFMIFRGGHSLDGFRVILCKRGIFDKVLLPSGESHKYVGKFSGEIGKQRGGSALYTHGLETFYVY